MGYDASWTPSAGGATQTARVLFGEPTKDDRLGEYGDNYNLRTFFMEYYSRDFIGLFESVQDVTEELVTISIDDIDRTFVVLLDEAKYDGRNYRVKINERL
jgi:hypothetical protein